MFTQSKQESIRYISNPRCNTNELANQNIP